MVSTEHEKNNKEGSLAEQNNKEDTDTKQKLKLKVKPIKKKKHGPRVSLKHLHRKKDFLDTIGTVGCQDAQVQIMENMRANDLKLICNCLHDFSMNPNIMNHYLSDSEYDTINSAVTPWRDSLRKFTNVDVPIVEKYKLLRKKQKGGSVMLAAIIGTLLPLAVDAIKKYVWPKK